MHGRKKRTEPIPEEEIKRKKELADKIGKAIDEFLEFRKDPSKIKDPMEYTAVMVNFCPEIHSIYNLRREIMNEKMEAFSIKEKYQFLGKELKLLLPIMKQNPKSYCLWYHRQWCIVKAIAIEEQVPQLEQAITKGELGLCEAMLAKDERNFHVWNYRNWIIKRIKKPENDVVIKELSFLDTKLEHNFSNFSALHFKSKNLVSKYALMMEKNAQLKFEELENLSELKEALLFGIPLSILKEELEKTKTGLFMQSQEQSMWLYNKWLLSRVSPIRISSVTIASNDDNKLDLKITLNRKTKGISSKILQLTSQEKLLEATITGSDQFSQYISISIPKTQEIDFNQLSFKFLNLNEVIEQNLAQNFEELKEFRVKDIDSNSLLDFKTVQVNIKDNNQTIYTSISNGQNDNLVNQIQEIVDDQNQLIDELAELEPENRLIHDFKIYFIENLLEQYSNTPEIIKNRISLSESLLKSAELSLEHNPKLSNRFTYLVNIYKFKLEALRAISNNKTQDFKAHIEDAKKQNLKVETKFLDLLALF